MRRRILRSVVTLPALLVLWLVSNTLGVTPTVGDMLDTRIPDGARVPVLEDALNRDDHIGEATTVGDYRAALGILDTIPVKGRASATGYDRAAYGPAWSDAAGSFAWTRNGLDTRNDVLYRDLERITCKPSTTSKTGSCKVLHGTLTYEPYTGTTDYAFDATDNRYATDLDIEHLVPLGWAWQHGAQRWSPDRRAAFANAPDVLIAVDPSQNRQHGDSGPAAWQPHNKTYRCTYHARWVQILDTWDLWINPADRAALTRHLQDCL